MALTDAGALEIAKMIMNDTPVLFTNALARIGVGDGTTAFAANQADLVGANKFRKAMDATYPVRATNVLTFRATFATGEANFAGGWQEWAVFNAGAAGTMLNRRVENLGVKTAAQSWELTVALTISAT